MERRTRFILRGANPIVAERYAEQHGWTAVEWFYVGGHKSDELLIIDLDNEERL